MTLCINTSGWLTFVAAWIFLCSSHGVVAHQGSPYIGGHNIYYQPPQQQQHRQHQHKSHFPHFVAVRKTISLPKHVPVVKHVPLPLPYPVFKHHQIPMYKSTPVKMEKIVNVPVKVPKYYPVAVHKIIQVPRYVEVPIEVPVYQEVIVQRPVEVPVPVYIRRPVHESHGIVGGAKLHQEIPQQAWPKV